MPTRPTLVRSIPFWVLFVGSLALTGFGAWMVFDRLVGFENGVREGAADQAAQLDLSISTYTVGPAATAGAVILGAGVIGLLLTAAVAAIASVLPRPAVAHVEAGDLTAEETPDATADRLDGDAVPVTDAPGLAHLDATPEARDSDVPDAIAGDEVDEREVRPAR